MSGLQEKGDMIMQQAMDEVTTTLEGVIPEKLKIVFEKYRAHAKTEILNHALKVGDTMPDFLLPNVNGELISSIDLRAQGPLIITFIRGDWCPYCHTTINILQEYHVVFKSRGANLVAISPQSIETSQKMSDQAKMTYPLLSDQNCEYAINCDIAFKLDDDFFQTLNSVVPDYNGNDDWLLPCPSTFVIDTDGKILYSFLETEIWKRAEPSNIMMALPPLKVESLNTMSDRMEHYVNKIKSTVAPKYVKIVQNELEDLRVKGVERKAIQVGQSYVPFELPNIKGDMISSRMLLKQAPLLLSFIQGAWSEFDEIELMALKKAYKNLKSRGVNVIVISPSTVAENRDMAEELKLRFPVLSDHEQVVASKYKLVYETKFVLEVDRRPASTSNKLVVPATYMINQKKKVEYAHVNVDPSIRADPKRLTKIAPAPVKSSGFFMNRDAKAPGIFSIKKMGWLPFVGKKSGKSTASSKILKGFDASSAESGSGDFCSNSSISSATGTLKSEPSTLNNPTAPTA